MKKDREKPRARGLFYYAKKLGYLKEEFLKHKPEKEEEFTKTLSSEEKTRVHFLWAKQQLLQRAYQEGLLKEDDSKQLLQKSLQSSIQKKSLHLRALKEGRLRFSQIEDLSKQLVAEGILLSWEKDLLLRAAKASRNTSKSLPVDSFSELLSSSNSSQDHLGPYQILEKIGSGGMGKVYKARHKRLDKTVAIKVLLQDSETEEVDRGRFLAEAKLIAKLNHPNIVRAQDFGNAGGQDYIVMDLVEGESLEQILDSDKKLSFRKGVKILRDVTLAISYAHQEGFIHRDLKPANLMIDKQGKPLVMDFGLAKKIQGGKDLTKTGEILGTPRYMAPEQTGGQGSQISALTDVYALGAILYEVITGHKAISGESFFNIVYRIAHGEIVPPRQLVSSIALDLETICMKALEKDPAKRYSSAQAMADDMTRFLEGEMILARPHSLWQKARKKIYKNRVFVTSVALLLCGIMATFAWNKQVLDQKVVIEKNMASWNAWWNDWEENFQKDYLLLQSVDKILQKSEGLISSWEKHPKRNYHHWVSYDDKLFSTWQNYESSLASLPSFFSKYSSMINAYEKLKEKSQWKELQLSQKGENRLANFLLKISFPFSEKCANPASIMVRHISQKVTSLNKKSKNALKRYGEESSPSLLEKIRWYLGYSGLLLKDLQSLVNEDNQANLSAQKEIFEEIKADRENIWEQALGEDADVQDTKKILFPIKKNNHLEKLCQMDITYAPAYFQLAQIKHQFNYREARIVYEKCNRREKKALSFFYLMDIYFTFSHSIVLQLHRSQSKESITSRLKELDILTEKNLQSFQKILEQTRSRKKKEFFKKMKSFYEKMTKRERYISEIYPENALGNHLELHLVPKGASQKALRVLEPKIQKDYLEGIQVYYSLLTTLEKLSSDYLPQWIFHWKSVIYLDLDFLGEAPKEGKSYLEKALAAQLQAVKKEPRNIRFQKQLAKIYSVIGNFDQVGQVYQKISPPMNSEMNLHDFSYAWGLNKDYYLALLRQGNIEKAQEILEKYFNYFQILVRKNPEASAQHSSEEVYNRSEVFWLSFLYLTQNKVEKIQKVFPYWKCYQKMPSIHYGETMVQHWLYFICAMKLGEKEKAIIVLKALWIEISRREGEFAQKVEQMGLLFSSQVPFLLHYDNILNSPVKHRKLPRAFGDLLDKMQEKLGFDLSYSLLDYGPLLKFVMQSVRKDLTLERKINQVAEEIFNSQNAFYITFYTAIKMETDFREDRLRKMQDLSNPKLLLQRATGYFRQSLYTLENKDYLKKALKDVLLALEKEPANADYHYACALLYAALSQKEKDYSYLAFFHLSFAAELGWSHFDFLIQEDPYWKPFLSQASFRSWMENPKHNLLAYSFLEIDKRSKELFRKGYQKQAKLIIKAYLKKSSSQAKISNVFAK